MLKTLRKLPSKKKWFYGLCALFIVLLLSRIGVLVVGKIKGGTETSRRPPVAVEVDTVRTGHARDIREFTGSVFPAYQYIVAPKVSGRIIELRKRIGDRVVRGETLGRIDDAEYQQAVREAEASLKIAQASLAEATSQLALVSKDLERYQTLQEKGLASPAELDAARTNRDAQKSRLELAEAQVEQRVAALTTARIRLDYTVLHASEPGFIGERFADEGALLSPNAPVLSVVGINRVIIRTTVTEKDYSLLRVGQPTGILLDAFPNRTFPGRVFRIAPILQQTSRMAEIEVQAENDSLLLKPGMFTRVRVQLAEKENALLVSTRSVVSRQGVVGVFHVNEEAATVRFVPVQTGIVMETDTEIVSPPLEGLVVGLGQHLLSDGSPVILPGREASPPPEPRTRQTGPGRRP